MGRVKYRVLVSHLRMEKYDEQGKPTSEDVTHHKDDVISLPEERARRLGSSVSPIEKPEPIVKRAEAKPPAPAPEAEPMKEPSKPAKTMGGKK